LNAVSFFSMLKKARLFLLLKSNKTCPSGFSHPAGHNPAISKGGSRNEKEGRTSWKFLCPN